MVVDAGDLESSFNMWYLPDSWKGFTAFEKMVSGQVARREAPFRVGTRTIPLGFRGAIDLVQSTVKNLVLGCVFAAILIHPDLNDWATFDILWTAGLYADTIAMIPQLLVISKAGQVPKYTAHFIMAMAVSKLFSAGFWFYGAENIARSTAASAVSALRSSWHTRSSSCSSRTSGITT